MATCNGGKYLPAQLDSLARQTRFPAELVVTDDASTDDTRAIILDFAARAPFPVHLHENHARLGYRDNFMRAVTFCRSGLIAFCDQDDEWDPRKLEVMEGVFADPEVCLAFHNALVVDRSGRGDRRIYPAHSGVEVFPPLGRKPWIVVPGFTQVFRASLARFMHLHAASTDLDWPGETVPHDRWFYFLASVFGRIAFVGEPLARYRQHGENAFGLYTDRRSEFDRAVRGESFIHDALAWARNRCELLQGMRSSLSPQEDGRAAEAIAYYEDLHRRLSHRMQVYAPATLHARLRAFLAFARHGGYAGIHGSARFGWREQLVDACVGVPFAPLMRGRWPGSAAASSQPR